MAISKDVSASLHDKYEGEESNMIKKRVYVIWDDEYHPEATYTAITHKLFNNDKWELTTTYKARDILYLEQVPDLVLNWTIGRPLGVEPDLSPEEQAQMKKLVEGGMNAMYIHAGLACIQDNTPIFDIARGRFASHPEPHNPVYCCALPGSAHLILKGFESFVDPDEHYFCKVDVENVTPFLCSISDAGTEIAGWTQEVGKGRVCCMTPGHNAPMLAKMETLLSNAAAWCVGEL